MFNKRKQREAMADMVSSYKPTSKSGLKSFCIMAAKGNVDEAERLYNFFIKDMEDLPMFDPEAPSVMDNARNAVTGFFGFVRDNKDGIGQVYDFIRAVAASRGKTLPPLGGNVAETVAESLPEIN